MKKSLLLLSMAALLWSCSNDEPASKNPSENEGRVSNYLSVKIRPASAGGRATYEQGGGTYEDGIGEESAVNAIRLYFFDAAGNAAKAFHQGDTYSNYWDWNKDIETGSGDHNQTVEETVIATVVPLTMDEMSEKPAYIVAVINPTANILQNVGSTTPQGVVGMSLKDLRRAIANYMPSGEAGSFVMSNSVYADNDVVIDATPINPNCFQPTEDAAKENPVIIYVERVIARVDFGVNMEGATDMDPEAQGTFYKIGSYLVEEYDETAKKNVSHEEVIYVKFLGWNVTTTTNVSRLIKSIDTGWSDQELMGDLTLWNSDNYHRSFWAINPPVNGNPGLEFSYGDFGRVDDSTGKFTGTGNFATALDIPAKGNYKTAYLQENAAPDEEKTAGPTNPSQVIVGAQLVDKSGNPFTLCQWGSYKYTLNGLKNAVADVCKLYYKEGDEYIKIKPSMIDFEQISASESNQDNNYAVFPIIAEGVNYTWYIPDATNTMQPIAQGTYENLLAAVNAELKNEIGSVMIWNTGWTYYYFDIRHLGYNTDLDPDKQQNIAAFGIVRNHIYRTTVTSVKGLGTPVYNPDQVIYPEPVDPTVTSLAAQIDILSWRVVAQDYEFVW
ncbi:MAG: Mfa1 fimbrilin C-terminal domain-containing protein [Muribaculaceae bacterium]|nr:Mfa1 fimbrilin C-terminal domain-containing protein [Muribaculaceae bacterium]